MDYEAMLEKAMNEYSEVWTRAIDEFTFRGDISRNTEFRLEQLEKYINALEKKLIERG